jgi:hypothetical protein
VLWYNCRPKSHPGRFCESLVGVADLAQLSTEPYLTEDDLISWEGLTRERASDCTADREVASRVGESNPADCGQIGVVMADCYSGALLENCEQQRQS